MAGSAILRIGYERWLRNLAVGLGNAPRSARAVGALRSRAGESSALVREHVAWPWNVKVGPLGLCIMAGIVICLIRGFTH